jgi:hypothetical protein
MAERPYIARSGSSLTWVDRETVRYTEGEFSALVWVDYEPGFFARGRIIRTSSLATWETTPANAQREISPEQKQRIGADIQEYFRSQRRTCRTD